MDTLSADSETVIIKRLDRLPRWPYPSSLLWIIGAGYFFGFFDVVNIGFALPVISKQFHVTSSVAASAISVGLVGYIIGSYLNSTISDLWGRRLSLTLSVALFTLGSVLCTFSPNLVWLDIFRFITGMGIGAEISSVTTYLGELSPAPLRGRYTGWATTFAYTGFSVVPFIALALVPHFAWGWRALLLFGAIGGVTITFLRRKIPESPHWLLSKNRTAEARQIVIQAEQYVQEHYRLPLGPVSSSRPVAPSNEFPTRTLLAPPYLFRLLLFVVIWFVYYIANYAWLTLAPSLFVSRGYSLASTIGYLVVSGIGFFVGAVGSALFGDRFERKWFILVITIVFGLSLSIIGLFPSPAVIMILGFIASVTIGLMVPLLYALTAEHFPTSARATGVALTDGLGHIGGALAPVFVLSAVAAGGFTQGFLVMAIACALTALLLPFAINATKRNLETVSENWNE